MAKLKRPVGFFEQDNNEQVDQVPNQSTDELVSNLTNKLTNKSTNELTNQLTSPLTNKLVNESTSQLTDQPVCKLVDDNETFLSGLKRPDNDKKMVGFHLTGDVRRALKKLKADDYEMSEVVNQMLRKYLPSKYFE